MCPLAVSAAWGVPRTGASGLAIAGDGIAAAVASVVGTVAKLALALAIPGTFVFAMFGWAP
jgi:hypothetical protein